MQFCPEIMWWFRCCIVHVWLSDSPCILICPRFDMYRGSSWRLYVLDVDVLFGWSRRDPRCCVLFLVMGESRQCLYWRGKVKIRGSAEADRLIMRWCATWCLKWLWDTIHGLLYRAETWRCDSKHRVFKGKFERCWLSHFVPSCMHNTASP